MTVDQILATIGLIGLGGLLKTGFDFLIATKKSKHDAKHVFKETRYKAIILLCFALVYYDREKTMLVVNRPDINSYDRLKNEIHAEFINMSLFGSDSVIFAMKKLFKNQDTESLNNLAITMRKDLYDIKTSLKSSDLDLYFKK